MALYVVEVRIVLEDEGRVQAWDTVVDIVAPLVHEHECIKQVTLKGLRADDYREQE
jgi:hypothetical protein